VDHPSSQMDSVIHLEKQVEAALDDLVATGALQETNRMDIDLLLNPVGESHDLTETSDDEIYQAVINAINAHANIEINGGDDVNDVPLEPHLTQRDLLKATSTITQYTEEMLRLLILNKYRQSSNSSVLAFKFKVQRQLRMPIARYCLSVELVQVRSNVDS
jgi:hypothetical protein